MKFSDIVEYWSGQRQAESGCWTHPEDEEFFASTEHSFNLDFPVSPYVGDIINAPVIILGANAGYDSVVTPTEFPDNASVIKYVERVRRPVESDWSWVAQYYDRVNYNGLLVSGKAALINACPYRSKKISEEPKNIRLLNRLPSTKFARSWLLEAVVPLAQAGERLIVAKRPRLWNLPPYLKETEGVVFDPAPISPQITRQPWAAVVEYLQARATRRDESGRKAEG